MSDQPRSTVLLLDAGGYRCALALPDVAEVMRPLPIEAVTGVPDAVRGIALIRRAPVPVVDLASILQDRPPAACTRLVCVRTGQRTVALGVDRVFGVRELPVSLVSDLPPLLRAARPGVIEAI